MLISVPIFASSEHNHNHDSEHEVDHLSIYDTFFGGDELHQVCYSNDHRKFFYIIFLFMLLSVLLSLIFVVVKHKYNKKLKKQKAVISEKNKEMIDSIQYALGIQKTILPTDKDFNRIAPNSFVYYRPKDIVSGDFYYCAEVDECQYIAVIDCTGHGVPGAFLTLIGNQALNRAIHDDEIYQPNEILSQMNRYVKQSLKQMEQGGIQDGMEIGLVKIDKKKDSIEFAGAGLNLLLVNDNGIERIKGDRLSVGTKQCYVSKGPENKVLKLSSYQKAFLYTDGVVDQFGTNDEKFKTKRLLSLLEKNKSLSIQEIRKTFVKVFETWKGDKEQVDDITFIGMEF